jgi:hypothetical protein
VHFLLGIPELVCTPFFFFKSSSLLVSFYVLVILAFLLVANELNRFRALGLSFKFALLSICVLSFFASVSGFIGSMGIVVFMPLDAARLCASGGHLPAHSDSCTRSRCAGQETDVVLPFGLVLVGFLSFICSG